MASKWEINPLPGLAAFRSPFGNFYLFYSHSSATPATIDDTRAGPSIGRLDLDLARGRRARSESQNLNSGPSFFTPTKWLSGQSEAQTTKSSFGRAPSPLPAGCMMSIHCHN